MNGSTYTTDELLDLLESKLPQEMTGEEVAALKSAAQSTVEVREALLETLGLEHGIATAYGADLQDIGAVFAKLDKETRSRVQGSWKVIGLLSLTILLAALGAFVYVKSRSHSVPVDVAQRRAAETPPIDNQEPAGDLQVPVDPKDSELEAIVDGDATTDPNDPESVTEAEATATAAAKNNEVVVVPSNGEPAWRVFDDPPLRGDSTWRDSLNQIVRPIGGARLIPRTPPNNIRVRDVALHGTFSVLPPADGRSIRLRMGEIERLRWCFWRGDKGVLVRYLPEDASLRAFTVRRDGDHAGLDFASDGRTAIDRSIVRRVDSQVNVSWNKQTLPESIQGPRFSVRWQGALRFPDAGDWFLKVTTAGSVAVWVDDKQVIYRTAVEQPRTAQGRVWYGYTAHDRNTPKTASLRIEYTDSIDGAISMEWRRIANRAQGKWRRPEIPQNRIPASAFLTSENSDEAEQGLLATYFPDPDQDRPGPIQVQHLVDDDRGIWHHEFGTGAVDVRYEAGAVRIARGDFELLTLPMQPPEQFLMETQCQLQHAAVYNLSPLKRGDNQRERVATTELLPPADVNWNVEAADAEGIVSVKSDQDDSIAFSRSGDATPWQSMTTIPREQGAEINMKIDLASTGTGVMLVDPSNPQLALQLLIAEYEGTRVLCERSADRDAVAASYRRGWLVDDSFWVRLIVGLNDVRVQFSNNGQTWIMADQRTFAPNRPIDQPIRFGVCGSSESGTQRIRVGKIEVWRPDNLERLATAAYIARATERFGQISRDSTDWQTRFESLIQAQPDDANAAQWDVACRLVMLSSRMPSQERVKHVNGLLETLVPGELDWQAVKPALAEMPRRFDFSSRPLSWPDLREFYNKKALAYWSDHELRYRIADLTDTWRLQLQTNRHFGSARTMQGTPIDLGRLNLYALSEIGDSDRLWSAAIRQYGLAINGNGGLLEVESEDLSHLAQWMQLQAEHPIGQIEEPDAEKKAKELMVDSGGKYGWLRSLPMFHPLRVEPYSRDWQNLVHEVNAAIERQDWDAASEAIIREPLPIDSAVGITRGDVLVAMDVVVRQWLTRHPQLAASLQQKQQVGRLRLNRAIKRGDLTLLESIAVQFHMTEVGNAAEEFLADRELSMREFLHAARRYSRLAATRSADADHRDQWNARYRLAMALAGREAGEPTTRPVRLSGREISAEQFEQLVIDSLDYRSSTPEDTVQINTPVAPVTDSMEVVAQWSVDREASEAWYSYRPIDFGWGWRDDEIYLNQPSQLAAFNTYAGEETMTIAAGPVIESWLSRNTRGFGRPLVLQSYVIAPTCRNDRIELTCITRESGEVVWSKSFDDTIIGEPVLCDGTIVAIGLRNNTEKDGVCVLRRLDPATGQCLLSREIARVELSRGSVEAGRPLVHEDNLLFRCGGGVICCDLLGKVQWIRKLPFLPHQVDRLRFDELLPGDLLAADGCVIVSAPGSWNVECREIITGKCRWITSHPNLERVIGISGNRVVLATCNELHALDLNSGKVSWRKQWQGNSRSLLLDAVGNVNAPEHLDGQLSLLRIRAGDGTRLAPVKISGKTTPVPRVDRMLTDGQRVLCVHMPDSGRFTMTLLQPVEEKP